MIDNQITANSILGGTLGSRQDAKAGFDFKGLNLYDGESWRVQKQELELA